MDAQPVIARVVISGGGLVGALAALLLARAQPHWQIHVLEPNEQVVARMLAQGMTNEQIAERMGFRDKRTISRTNGQIYAAWGLDASATDEKVARTRAVIIMLTGRLLYWDETGVAQVQNEKGEWITWSAES